ncbi:unnamed protein product [Linum tenue]|uniref:Uncharacterized protein n=1 Tax=Linum tenue TaxID=586396 RepID=A0AAV0SAI7_9ROSI|nr:unnamed protein product [Linum tenue]
MITVSRVEFSGSGDFPHRATRVKESKLKILSLKGPCYGKVSALHSSIEMCWLVAIEKGCGIQSCLNVPSRTIDGP